MLLGTRHEFATARHQQTDGRCERAIQEAKAITRKYLDYAGKNWRRFLPLVEFAINSTPRRRLFGLTAFEVESGRTPVAPGWHIEQDVLRVMNKFDRDAIDAWRAAANDIRIIVQQELRNAQDVAEQSYDQGRRPLILETGDQVDLDRRRTQRQHRRNQTTETYAPLDRAVHRSR